jgi:selenocysteine lyase/cysteine desulfurase
LVTADRAFATASRKVGLRASAQRSPGDDRDWTDVLGAFDLGGRITMNAANLAPASAPARAAFTSLAASIDTNPSFQNRAQFADARRVTRERLAAFLRADPDEIVLTRNTTEGNNFIVQGLDLGPGDEVLLSTHNHPSNMESWKVRAERVGFKVIEVPLESPPPSPEALLDGFRAAATPRTRVVSFSHVTNTAGCRFPAQAISEWARENDILTLADGAQTCGALDVDLHTMGCDFYTASGHKWPCAPREVGVLYIRKERQAQVWPGVVGLGPSETSAADRFEELGQRDDAALAAFGHAILFLQEIGSATIEARLAALTGLLKEELSKLPGVTIYAPMEADFSGGVVTFHIDGVDERRAHEWLYRERQIVSAPSSVEAGGVRFSPHIFTSLAECERAVEAMREIISGAVQI